MLLVGGLIPWFALLWAGAAAAASIDVSPVLVSVPPDGRQTTLRVDNSGAEEILVQVKAVPWVTSDMLDAVQPVRDLLVVPPVFKLSANGRQVLRVALRRPLTEPREQAYRLVITEVPRDLPAFGGVAMGLRFNLPVFVTPAGAAPAPGWTVRSGASGRAELVVTNMGTARISIQELVLHEPAGAALLTGAGPETALAGESKSWPLDRPLSALPQTLEVRAKTNRGPLVAEVRPHDR